MDVVNEIQKIAEFASENFFDPFDDLKIKKETKEQEGLGIAIAKWADRDGIKILNVFRNALEDSYLAAEADLIKSILKINSRYHYRNKKDDAMKLKLARLLERLIHCPDLMLDELDPKTYSVLDDVKIVLNQVQGVQKF